MGNITTFDVEEQKQDYLDLTSDLESTCMDVPPADQSPVASVAPEATPPPPLSPSSDLTKVKRAREGARKRSSHREVHRDLHTENWRGSPPSQLYPSRNGSDHWFKSRERWRSLQQKVYQKAKDHHKKNFNYLGHNWMNRRNRFVRNNHGRAFTFEDICEGFIQEHPGVPVGEAAKCALPIMMGMSRIWHKDNPSLGQEMAKYILRQCT